VKNANRVIANEMKWSEAIQGVTLKVARFDTGLLRRFYLLAMTKRKLDMTQ